MVQREKTLGDVAVDGLLAGMAAGVAMAAALMLLGLTDGISPLEMLGRFDPAGAGAAAVGGLLHLAVSGIYGVLFAVLLRFLTGHWARFRPYVGLLGTAYGLALWFAAQFVFLPGLDTALSTIAPSAFTVAHVVYGSVLGYILGRFYTD